MLNRAQQQSGFLGLDENLHPRDFGALALCQADIQKIPSRYPLPGPMSPQQFSELVAANGRDEVEWQGLN